MSNTATKTDTANGKITINTEQRLFVIPCGEGEDAGYTCLGFDVCEDRITRYAAELGIVPGEHAKGTLAQYAIYTSLVFLIRLRFEESGIKSSADLTPQLVGLEGKQVEVVDSYGEKRKFFVGKSMGWIPCHLEIEKRNDDGGCAVMGAPFRSIRILSVKSR
jgi:hypothetical protein